MLQGVLSRFFAAVALLALAGCVNIERIEFDKSANASVRKIALLPVPEPAAPVVMNIGGAAGAFGLVGGLVQAGINEDNSKRFKQALDAGGVTFAPAVVAAVTQELKARGFEVVYLAGQRPKLGPDGKSVDYTGIQTDADAILSVWFGVTGYASPAMSMNYQPWVTVGARLVDAKTKQPLYFRVLRSGFGSSNEKVEDVGYDEKYHYGSADALVASAGEAAAGLQESHRRVVRRVAESLR